jgi:hypothetical protein
MRRASVVRTPRELKCSFPASAEGASMAGALILALAALKDLKMHEFKIIESYENIINRVRENNSKQNRGKLRSRVSFYAEFELPKALLPLFRVFLFLFARTHRFKRNPL